MSTMSHYRPSKRPSVKQVSEWRYVYWDTIDSTWRGEGHREVNVEQGYPFPDFYRVQYTVDGIKKSKLFYGESAWNDTERFVYDLGFSNVLGMI
jgi:hypothetical protein